MSCSFLYIFKSKPSTAVQPSQEQKAENRSEANWANSAGSVSVPSAPLANRTPDSCPPGSASQLHFLRAHFPNSSPIFLSSLISILFLFISRFYSRTFLWCLAIGRLGQAHSAGMWHGPDHIHMAVLRESEPLIKKSELQMLTVICALFQHVCVCIMRGISKPTSNSS